MVFSFCSNSDFMLTLTFLRQDQIRANAKHNKISWKILKVFSQECSSNDDLKLTLSVFMARSNLHS